MSNVLVMLQTNSNQPFIFSSPRLREQIGASFEITLLSHWVKEEAEKLLKPKPLPTSFWISDSSGKVIVRFTGDGDEPKAKAKDLIRRVTLQALTEAPGLDVTGVFIEATFDKVDARDLNKLDRVFLEYSLNRRPAAARFPQFPFLERGSESALPASASLGALEFSQESLQPDNFDESSPLSLPSRVKRLFASTSRKRQVDDVQERLAKEGKELKQEPPLDPTKLAAAFQDGEEFEDAKNMLSSVGVVHIDGNGVGAIMRDLGSAHSKAQEAGVCVSADEVHTDPDDALQAFIMVVNKRLDKTVKDAIALSWYDVQELTPDSVVPIVPVLVGGDDVTVYTDGRFAIPFAEAYIRHYEELTEKDELLKQLAVVAGAKEAGPLTASAGVAIVGRNFPFHIAYDLAEELVSRGKTLGKKPGTVPCSTINFHVLRDATVLDPEDTLDEYKGRSQRPFLIGCYAPDRIGDATTTSAEEAPTAKPQPLSSWARILQAVAAFDGMKPDDPMQTSGDPFPRARANRIVKLLADYVTVPKDDKARSECLGYVLKDNEQAFATQEQIDNDKQKSDGEKQKSDDAERITKRCNHPICTIRLEWTEAQENARGTKTLVKALGPLPSKTRLDDPDEHTEDCIEQVRWLLDLIDLSRNLPDRYLASRIRGDVDCVGSQEAADKSTAGGAQ
ncbi:MAG: Cas10/Cmr2 second palm domain-containing protein [Pauljensenia sp.]